MEKCSLCGSYEERLVGFRTETDYDTGSYIPRNNICRSCSNAIAYRNQWYKEFVNFFNSHPGRLKALEAIHEEDILSMN